MTDEKLTCRDFVDFLMDYLDGELATDSRAEFDRHLDVCPGCKNYLATYEQSVELGKKVCRHDDGVPGDVPEELVQAILAARKTQ